MVAATDLKPMGFPINRDGSPQGFAFPPPSAGTALRRGDSRTLCSSKWQESRGSLFQREREGGGKVSLADVAMNVQEVILRAI